jgi:geranylgeranyl diphosphate synthase type II
LTFEQYFEAKRALVERALAERIATRWRGVPERLLAAMRYSLDAGGKRLRPVLALAAAESVSVNPLSDAAIDYACALELVHTYSLIHDDLPAMDDDDLRRGKPTSHKVFGEALAILAGDALLTESFAFCANAGGAVGAALCRELALGAGAHGMVGGQLLDLELASSAELSEVERSHLGKTGALFGAATAGGGIAAGAGEADVERLRSYGRLTGLAFQAADDLLDVVGDPQARGKRSGGDAALGKATMVSLLGVDGARAHALECEAQAEKVAALLPHPERLIELARFAAQRAR